METEPHIVILAAGRGKRMRSQRPKALHPVLFRPMIDYVLDLALSLPHQSLSMVVGRGEEKIEAQCRAAPGLRIFEQEEPLGTGHAVQAAEPFLGARGGPVLILSADVILLSLVSLKKMLERHIKEKAAGTIAATTLANPRGYGRIIRQIDGRVVDIREEADCAGGERAINEVNAGIYYFQAPELFAALARVTNRNAQREYYLTDAVRVLAGEGRKIIPFSFGDPTEVLGIDNRHSLWRVESILQERVNQELMHRGVTLQDPRATWIDPRCRIEEDVRIEAGSVLIDSIVERDVTIENHCRIVASRVGEGSHVKQGSYVEGSVIGRRCSVGPYAQLKPENFVELTRGG